MTPWRLPHSHSDTSQGRVRQSCARQIPRVRSTSIGSQRDSSTYSPMAASRDRTRDPQPPKSWRCKISKSGGGLRQRNTPGSWRRGADHISLLDKVSTNPDEYYGMLRAWLGDPNSNDTENWSTVFERQVARWRGFLAWRKEKRGIYDPDTQYSVFVEQYRRLCALHPSTGALAELEADPLSAKKDFESSEKSRRREQRRLLGIEGDGGFSAYAEAVKQRLAKRGFTREFQLNEDLAQQDRLATWIEYLCYEYFWYDVHARDVQQYDRRWKQLVDSRVLRPGETDESLRTGASAMRRGHEEQAAAEAVELAESAASVAASSDVSSRESLQKAANAKLDNAKALLKRTKRRGDLILEFLSETEEYAVARKALERQDVLLQWVLEQVPLIEAELNESGMNGGGSHHGRSPKQRRGGQPTQRQPGDGQAPSLSGTGSTAGRVSKRRQDEEPDDERPSKRPRADETRTGALDVPGIPAARGRHLQASDEGQQSPVIPTPQPLRRSARIAAARQAPPRIAIALPPAVKNPPRGRRQVATQASRSSPRTRAEAQHSGSSAEKAAKRRRPGKPRPEGGSKRQSSQRQRR